MASITTWWTQVAEDTGSARTASRFYHPELDILRFFAFFGVFLHHALPHELQFYTGLKVAPAMARVLAAVGASGAFGVDLFFVLSAFLITELLLREKEFIGTIDLRSFYVRRILRIWPLYFAFLTLAVAMQFFVQGQSLGWRATLAFCLLAGNWWIVFNGFPASIVFPLWSVSIEEQFYVVWPVVARRIRAATLGVIAIGVLFFATAARYYLVRGAATESQVWCNTFARLDPIAAGVLLAVVLRGRAPKWRATARMGMLLGGYVCIMTAAVVCTIKADPLTMARVLSGYPLVAAGASAILLATLTAGAPLSKSALVYLGKISYGLYVFHVLGLMMSDWIVPRGYTSMSYYVLKISVAFAVTVALSAISYAWLESPFLRMKRRFTHVESRTA